MALTNSRYTTLTLTLTLVMALGLVLGLFVDVKPVQAGACGSVYLYTASCTRRVPTVYDPVNSPCLPDWPAYYLVKKDDFQRLMNPPSYKKVGQWSYMTCSNPPSPDCPAYCN